MAPQVFCKFRVFTFLYKFCNEIIGFNVLPFEFKCSIHSIFIYRNIMAPQEFCKFRVFTFLYKFCNEIIGFNVLPFEFNCSIYNIFIYFLQYYGFLL